MTPRTTELVKIADEMLNAARIPITDENRIEMLAGWLEISETLRRHQASNGFTREKRSA